MGSFFRFPEGLSSSFFNSRVGSGFFGLLGPRVGSSLWERVSGFLGSFRSFLLTGVTASLRIILLIISLLGISIGLCDNSCNGLLATKGVTIHNGTLLSSQSTSEAFTGFLLSISPTYIQFPFNVCLIGYPRCVNCFEWVR